MLLRGNCEVLQTSFHRCRSFSFGRYRTYGCTCTYLPVNVKVGQAAGLQENVSLDGKNSVATVREGRKLKAPGVSLQAVPHLFTPMYAWPYGI